MTLPRTSDADVEALARWLPIDIMIDDLCHWIGTMEQDRAIGVMAFVCRLNWRMIHHPAFVPLVDRHYRRVNELARVTGHP